MSIEGSHYSPFASLVGAVRGEETVVNRKISTIIWRQVAPHEIELVHGNGESERMEGSHAEAARMAEAAGLQLTASPLGTVRWAQELPKGGTSPKRSGGTSPKRIGPWLSQ
jgi:hypothetical protein